jgi:hypothetical protein
VDDAGDNPRMDIVGWLVAGAVPVGTALLFVPRELWSRWRGRLVDRLDLALLRRLSRFDRHYREFVLSGLRFIDLKGLATVGFHTPELDEVYVDVSLVRRPPHEVPEDVLGSFSDVIGERRSIDDFVGGERPAVLAVIGAPGSGKTTLLRHTARSVCRDRRDRNRTVPILLYLRDHVETIVSTPDITLPALVRGTLGRYAETEPPGWFEQRLAAGVCVVLLDGLDEVSRPEERRIVAGWVERQVRQFPDNDYVVTSRPHGYRTASIDGAVVVQVRGFTDEQVTRFVRSWYFAVEKHGAKTADEEARVRAALASEDLLKRLSQAPALYELTVNPLLLTMVANVHHYRGALPGGRADLYSEICQVMLWRRQEAKKLPIELSGDQKETLLCGLAFSMMQRQVRDLPRSAALAELQAALERMPASVTQEAFLAELCRYGMLIERESGLYSFAHLTLQESLAASHIRAKGLVGVLVENVDDPWWREATLLYAARSDADPIVEACLAAGSVTALSLAFDCADQSNDLAPELRARLRDLFEADHSSVDFPRKVAVQITRHLRDVIQGVCARHVSAGIYRLFRQATGHPAPDGPNPDMDEPVTGVRGSDAAAFLDWVNQITDRGTEYRLPVRGELEHPAVQRALDRTPPLSVWMASQHRPELWTPARAAHPCTVDAATMILHLNRDVARAAPLFARLLLVRCAVAIRKHARERSYTGGYGLGAEKDAAIDRYATLARRLGGNPRLEQSLAATEDAERVLVLDLAIGHDCDRDLAYLRSEINEMAEAMAVALRKGHDVSMYNDPDFYNDRDNREKANREFYSATDEVERLVRDMNPGPADKVPAQALKQALSKASSTPSDSDWRRRFAEELIDATGIRGYTGTVFLDDMADRLRFGREAMQALPRPAGQSATWVDQVANRLQESAAAVFDRRRPLSADLATRIRLASLCLASEADAHGRDQVGAAFRDIAAGITLMERRATQQAPAGETITLALK